MTTHEALVQLRALRDEINEEEPEGRKTVEALNRAIDALACPCTTSTWGQTCTG